MSSGRATYFAAKRGGRVSHTPTFRRLCLEHLEPRRLLTAIRIGPYLQQPTPTSMVIMWETDEDAGSRVDYDGGFVEDSTPVMIHEMAITGLSADATYSYTVTSGDATSPSSTFTTAPETDRSFRFVAYGDTRSYPEDHAAVVQGIINTPGGTPEFVLHTGDLVGQGRVYTQWETQFFTPAHDLMVDTPMIPVLGNHEYGGVGDDLWFLDFFSLPNNEEWFAFDYSNVRFIGLNTMADYSPGSSQNDWLVAELQSAEYTNADWHIVYFHHPPYTATVGHYDDLNVQEHLVPLFEEYDVDMVFNGHSHAYERYYHNGVYYIVTGGGGAPIYSLTEDTEEPIREFGMSAYHHCVIDVDVPGESLTLSVRYNDGQEFDTITLTAGEDPAVVGRRVFYSNSSWDDPAEDRDDDDAIAPDKEALLPGGTATFANYTSYVRGLNGIMVDIANPAGTITDADFEFKVGNDNDPAAWDLVEVAPAVTVRQGDGTDGSERVTIVFPDGEIQRQWLQVTVLANENTGLLESDVFYFGNAIGESGNSADNAIVSVQDIVTTWANPHPFWNPAEINTPYDYDRDERVDATDILIARANQTWSLTALQLIDLSGSKSDSFSARLDTGQNAPLHDTVLEGSFDRESGNPEDFGSTLEWLRQFEQVRPRRQLSKADGPLDQAVDKLLAAGWR